MNSFAHFQICKLFEEPNYLFFEHGVVWSGDPMNGTRVLYRRNGFCKEIVTHVNGRMEGFRGTYLNYGSPHTLRHYLRGKLYGETQLFDRGGIPVEHAIYTGENDECVDFRDDLTKDYPGYCFCQRDWDVAFDYRDIGPKGWVDE